MDILDKYIGDKEAKEITKWWLRRQGIITDAEDYGIISDEESNKNFLDYKRKKEELNHFIELRERLVYGDMHENSRSGKIFIGFYKHQLSLN